jgi:hypothetical protein
MKAERQDEFGRAYKGSKLQIQIYVNRRTDELSCAILAALAPKVPTGFTIDWKSPLEGEKFVEYCDADFLRALGLARLSAQLMEFWPSGGPVWDALATVSEGSEPVGYILVEAKSYLDEMKTDCKATSEASLSKINKSLTNTKRWLGVNENIEWKKGLYQSANRLAHLYFLSEVAGLQTWMVNLCFVGDPHHLTSVSEWRDGLDSSKRRLGISVPVPGAPDVLLPARNRDEILAPNRRASNSKL